MDIWRAQNPIKREYSCWLSTFKGYSRIDYFLISDELISCIRNCQYSSIISDHAPVSLTYVEPKFTYNHTKWRFQIHWMQDKRFLEFLGEQIDYYFEHNTTQTSAIIRWEAFKAFIRGQIISYTSRKTKEKQEKFKTLETKIRLLKEKSLQAGQIMIMC